MKTSRKEEPKVSIDIPLLNVWRTRLNWQLSDLAYHADLSQRTVQRVYSSGIATVKTHRAIIESIQTAILIRGLEVSPPKTLAIQSSSPAAEIKTVAGNVCVDTQTVYVQIRVPGLSPETVTPAIMAKLQKIIDAELSRGVQPVNFEEGSLKITYELSPAEAEQLQWAIKQGLLDREFDNVDVATVECPAWLDERYVDESVEPDVTRHPVARAHVVGIDAAQQLVEDLRNFQKMAVYINHQLSPAPTFKERCDQMLSMAIELFGHAPTWVCFFREVLASGGLTRKLFPSDDEFGTFMTTPHYDQILQMLTALRSRDLPEQDPNDPQRMITVRVPKSLHEALCEEAGRLGISVNKLCISRLLQVLDPKMVPEIMPRFKKPKLREQTPRIQLTGDAEEQSGQDH